MDKQVFVDIAHARDPSDLFRMMAEYFRAKGYGSLCYYAPQTVTGPFILLESGLPSEWVTKYREQALERFDPIPGEIIKRGEPGRLHQVAGGLTQLSSNEKAFLREFHNSGVTEGLTMPAYGPHGRTGLIALTDAETPDLLDAADLPLFAAVAQHMHTRMQRFHPVPPAPPLSPREREIVQWMAKGKSGEDIGTILGIAPTTVATYVQRIFAKMAVPNRLACVTKALAHNII